MQSEVIRCQAKSRFIEIHLYALITIMQKRLILFIEFVMERMRKLYFNNFSFLEKYVKKWDSIA